MSNRARRGRNLGRWKDLTLEQKEAAARALAAELHAEEQERQKERGANMDYELRPDNPKRDYAKCDACPVYRAGGWLKGESVNVLIQPVCVVDITRCDPAADPRAEAAALVERAHEETRADREQERH